MPNWLERRINPLRDAKLAEERRAAEQQRAADKEQRAIKRAEKQSRHIERQQHWETQHRLTELYDTYGLHRYLKDLRREWGKGRITRRYDDYHGQFSGSLFFRFNRVESDSYTEGQMGTSGPVETTTYISKTVKYRLDTSINLFAGRGAISPDRLTINSGLLILNESLHNSSTSLHPYEYYPILDEPIDPQPSTSTVFEVRQKVEDALAQNYYDLESKGYVPNKLAPPFWHKLFGRE